MMKSPVLTRDQIPQFLRAIAHNRQTVLDQIRTGRFTDSEYYFVSEENGRYTLLPPGRRNAELARSFNDYFAGSLVGALPFTARHGNDAIKISPTGVVTRVELKLCVKSSSRYTINEKGYLTVLGSKSVVGFRSDCSACYEIKKNLSSKDVDTYFVIYDGEAHEVITVRKMAGEKILNRLIKVAPKDSEKAKKVSISLAAFMEEGEEVFLDFIDSVGVEGWEKRVYDRCGRDPQDTRSSWSAHDERFSLMWTSGVVLADIMAEFPERTKFAIQSRAKILRLKRPQNN